LILVTGATGHVGRAVVCRLASLGHDRKVAKVRFAVISLPLRAENLRAFEISFFAQTSGSPGRLHSRLAIP
jgi:nucleoside-diphosphate-sugar epimerase